MKFYTTADIAAELHCNVRQIGKLRRNGRLKGIRAWHGYVFSEKEIEQFYDTYAGACLSTDEKMQFAKLLKGCANG